MAQDSNQNFIMNSQDLRKNQRNENYVSDQYGTKTPAKSHSSGSSM